MASINLTYQVPIKENAGVDGSFLIRGTAIRATTTDNNHKFLTEELRKAAQTMQDIPLLVDHNNTVDSIKGRVINGVFNELKDQVDFEANVLDGGAKEKIQQGLIDSVSIGATVEDIEESDDGVLIPRGIKIRELSLVAVPADEGAKFQIAASANSFTHALTEAYNLKGPITSYSPVQSGVKRESKKEELVEAMSESTEKSNAQLEEMKALKAELSQAKEKLSEYAAKERKMKEEAYIKLCESKGLAPVEVQKLDEAVIDVLMQQVEAVQVKEADADEQPAEAPVEGETKEEPKEESKEEPKEQAVTEERSGYQILEQTGALKGGAFTVVREHYR